MLIIANSNLFAQEEIHWLVNQDSIKNCKLLRDGIYVNEETESKITEGYSIEIRGNLMTEKIQNGKYYLKSTITFTTDCSYELTVIETTIPGYESQIGTKIQSEILETASVDNLIKVRSKGENWQTFVFKKISN